VAHSGGSITVTGVTTDVDFVFKYAQDLRSAGGINSVVITSLARREDAGYSFSLLLK